MNADTLKRLQAYQGLESDAEELLNLIMDQEDLLYKIAIGETTKISDAEYNANSKRYMKIQTKTMKLINRASNTRKQLFKAYQNRE